MPKIIYDPTMEKAERLLRVTIDCRGYIAMLHVRICNNGDVEFYPAPAMRAIITQVQFED